MKDLINEITIGRHKYNQLKGLDNPTKEDLQIINIYESKLKSKPFNKEKFSEYWDNVINPTEEKEFKMNAHKLVNLFLVNYKKFNDVDFILTEESKVNLYTIAFYFAKDDGFFRSPNLVRQIDIGGKFKDLTPSFEKGNIIIGNFGNGKSSMLKTFCKTLQSVKDYNFVFKAARKLTKDYGCLSTPEEKKQFWFHLNKPRLLVDDAKSEDEASNYGKIDIVRELIESRADENKTTHIICNYKNGFSNDLNSGIIELGEKYGSRALDRIFGNYNVIEFKGKSFRK